MSTRIVIEEDEPAIDVDVPPFEPRHVTPRRDKLLTDEYSIVDFLGRGKFGEVKRCVETTTGREFAVKFISTPRPQDHKDVEHEVNIMTKLHHRRLVQLFDAFDSKREMCLVLEIIYGGELFDRVISEDFLLTERACVCFMRQICEGVEYMHSKNIIHLDLKPENILCLTKTGNRVKIIDFGLAREFDPKKDNRVMYGTPEFMAPEVVLYDPVDFATDMWSIGVMCYVLLSGLSPFMGNTDTDTLSNVSKGKYDFDAREFQQVSQVAKDFITQLLQADKKKRPSATQCLSHVWLKKPSPPPSPTLQLSKTRLKHLVCRRKCNEVPRNKDGGTFSASSIHRGLMLTDVRKANNKLTKNEPNALLSTTVIPLKSTSTSIASTQNAPAEVDSCRNNSAQTNGICTKMKNGTGDNRMIASQDGSRSSSGAVKINGQTTSPNASSIDTTAKVDTIPTLTVSLDHNGSAVSRSCSDLTASEKTVACRKLNNDKEINKPCSGGLDNDNDKVTKSLYVVPTSGKSSANKTCGSFAMKQPNHKINLPSQISSCTNKNNADTSKSENKEIQFGSASSTVTQHSTKNISEKHRGDINSNVIDACQSHVDDPSARDSWPTCSVGSTSEEAGSTSVLSAKGSSISQLSRPLCDSLNSALKTPLSGNVRLGANQTSVNSAITSSAAQSPKVTIPAIHKVMGTLKVSLCVTATTNCAATPAVASSTKFPLLVSKSAANDTHILALLASTCDTPTEFYSRVFQPDSNSPSLLSSTAISSKVIPNPNPIPLQVPSKSASNRIVLSPAVHYSSAKPSSALNASSLSPAAVSSHTSLSQGTSHAEATLPSNLPFSYGPSSLNVPVQSTPSSGDVSVVLAPSTLANGVTSPTSVTSVVTCAGGVSTAVVSTAASSVVESEEKRIQNEKRCRKNADHAECHVFNLAKVIAANKAQRNNNKNGISRTADWYGSALDMFENRELPNNGNDLESCGYNGESTLGTNIETAAAPAPPLRRVLMRERIKFFNRNE